jgi:hypothetical protein
VAQLSTKGKSGIPEILMFVLVMTLLIAIPLSIFSLFSWYIKVVGKKLTILDDRTKYVLDIDDVSMIKEEIHTTLFMKLHYFKVYLDSGSSYPLKQIESLRFFNKDLQKLAVYLNEKHKIKYEIVVVTKK